MSSNVELVRSIYAASARGDYSSAEWADPEIEYVYADGPAPGRSTGLESATRAWRDFLGVWNDFRSEAEEYRELDAERVLVLTRRTGRGKVSGVELEQMQTQGAALFQLRGGKVTRLLVYWDRKRALADLGLAPEGGSER